MEKGHYGEYTGNHPKFSKKKDESYDANKAYDKNLSASARLHYLENDRADHKSPAKAIDPMYNGKEGVQQGDFEQFGTPVKNLNKGYGSELKK